MKLWIASGILLSALTASAMESSELEELHLAIGEKELIRCLSDITRCGEIPGDLLSSGLVSAIEATGEASREIAGAPLAVCSLEEDPGRRKKRRKRKKKKFAEKEVYTELLLVSEVQPSQTERGSRAQNKYNPRATKGQWYRYLRDTELSQGSWPTADIVRISHEASTSHDERRSVFVDGLVEVGAQSGLNEKQLTDKVVESIKAYTSDPAEQMKILTTFSDRFYEEYNDSRNPFQNKPEGELDSGGVWSENRVIPSGKITLPEMFKASADFNFRKGGVCSDISSAVALIGEKLFPEKDVLVVNNGTHFGVMLHSPGEGNSLIVWSVQTDSSTSTMLDPGIPVGNTRIFQMKDGALNQIAVVDTDTGAAMKTMLGGPTPTLTTGTSPSVIYAGLKREVVRHEKTKTSEIKAGVAQTYESQMLILVAQRTRNTEGTQASTGIGVAQQTSSDGLNQNVIASFRTSLQKRLVHYQSPRLTITGSAGVEFDAQAAQRIRQDQNKMNRVYPYSASLQTNQTILLKSTPAQPGSPSVEAQL